MAAPACKVLATCRALERLVLSGPASTSCRLLSSLRPGAQTAVCGRSATVSSSSLLPAQGQSLAVCASAVRSSVVPCRYATWYTDKRISANLGAVGIPEVEPDFTPITDEAEGQELAQLVNSSLEQGEQGRLFAVVSILGRQRKVTTEDVLVVESDFPPTVGDRIRLEKVLMVGGKDFTLIGQPLLSREKAKVEATVIEKTLSHNKVWSTYRKRRRSRKLKLYRTPHTMIVINSIELSSV